MFFRGKGQGKQSSQELSEELKKNTKTKGIEVYKPFFHWCYCETLHLIVYQGLSVANDAPGTLTQGGRHGAPVLQCLH